MHIKNFVLVSILFSTAFIASCGKWFDRKIDPDIINPTQKIQAVVVFGDSVSDNGNLKFLTEKFAGNLSPLKRSIPISPRGDKSGYYEGRFSNGENWYDRLLKSLKFKVEGPSVCFTSGTNASCNYAIGGSTTSTNITSDDDPFKAIKKFLDYDVVRDIFNSFKIPMHIGTKEAVEAYLNSSEPEQNSLDNTLYVIWAGGNDYMANADAETTVSNLIFSIKQILDYKLDDNKRYFLIPNLPDFGIAPYAVSHPELKLGEKTIEHNTLLKAKLAEEILNNPQYSEKAVIVQMDLYAAFKEVAKNPAQYGFTNIKDACYLGSYMPGDEVGDCGNGNQYVFWDQIHLTAPAHCIITQVALKALVTESLIDKQIEDSFQCNLPG